MSEPSSDWGREFDEPITLPDHSATGVIVCNQQPIGRTTTKPPHSNSRDIPIQILASRLTTRSPLYEEIHLSPLHNESSDPSTCSKPCPNPWTAPPDRKVAQLAPKRVEIVAFCVLTLDVIVELRYYALISTSPLLQACVTDVVFRKILRQKAIRGQLTEK